MLRLLPDEFMACQQTRYWQQFHIIPFKFMKQTPLSFLRLLVLFFGLIAFAACAKDSELEPGYVSLFNGQDLTGWGYVTNNCDGQTESSDGRYTAKNGILVVNPHNPERGPRLRQLSTTKQFPGDFILRLEFRAAVNAD